MAIILDTSIDIIDKYREIADELTAEGSIYIKMKETLIDLLNEGNIKGTERAKVIGETIAQMAVGSNSAAMTMAFQIKTAEKELVLKKAELEAKLDIMAKELLKAEQDVDVSKETKRLAQAKRIREYGTATLDLDGNITSLADSGMVYQQQKLVEKQIEQGTTAISKIEDDKLTSAKQRLNIEKQTELYQRQKEGFDDNKNQKLFETQMNAWGIMFSSGLLPNVPSLVSSNAAASLYNVMKPDGTPLVPLS